MAGSRVKVTVAKDDLIAALETRRAELEQGTGEVPLTDDQRHILEALEEVAESIRTNKVANNNYPRGFQRLSDLITQVYYYRHEGRAKTVPTREELIATIDKQLKLLRLSSDTTVQVGINDELYDLL